MWRVSCPGSRSSSSLSCTTTLQSSASVSLHRVYLYYLASALLRLSHLTDTWNSLTAGWQHWAAVLATCTMFFISLEPKSKMFGSW